MIARKKQKQIKYHEMSMEREREEKLNRIMKKITKIEQNKLDKMEFEELRKSKR